MQEHIHATFTHAEDAEQAAGILLENGVRAEDLTLIKHHPMVEEAETEIAEHESNASHEAEQHTTLIFGGGVETGAVRGAKWGIGIGAVAALATILIPGVGLVIGAGSLAAAIGTVSIGAGAGALAGVVSDHYSQEGLEEADGKRIEAIIADGGAMISVALPSGNVDVATAFKIFGQHGGQPIAQLDRVPPPYVA